MKNILMILFLGIMIITGCGNEKFKSHLTTDRIKIDGDGSDWENLHLDYHENMHIMIGFANTDSSLNIMLRFRDPKLAQMFARRGVTIWFDENINKEKKIGIHIVDKKSHFRGFTPDQKIIVEPFNDIPTKLLNNFYIVYGDTTPIQEFEGFEAAMDYKDGLYCFEFVVPLQINHNKPLAISIPEEREIGIGLEIAGVSAEMREKIKREMGQLKKSRKPGRGFADTGIGGGDMPGERPGPGHFKPDMDAKEIWFTVYLAE